MEKLKSNNINRNLDADRHRMATETQTTRSFKIHNFHTYQPTCHPVAENVFPADDIVIVLSHMPGSDAK